MPKAVAAINIYQLYIYLLHMLINGIILPDTASFRQVKSALNFQISDMRNASPPHSFKLDSLEVGGIDWQEGYRVSKALCLALTRNPFAMIGHLNHRTVSTIFGFTTTYHMPYLTISTPLNRSHVKMTSSSAVMSSSASSSASANHHLYDLASYGMIRKPYHRRQENDNSNSNKYNNNNNKYNNNKYNNNKYKHPYSVSMGGDDDDNDDEGDDGDDNSDDVFILHMRPSYDRALIDVILHYKWNHVYYVYDDVEDAILHTLSKAGRDSHLKNKKFKNNNNNNINNNINNVNSNNTNNNSNNQKNLQ
ncbi:hypothetical protein HELRODRAFT_163207 [Helobdella robusta]|uniref:Receptor ligand binding region domain-containing protein n=1 Tax=Helobdella robusta TaxID=6412 RepID=T1ETS9_HELRO|nr:hypothetical protein HELRODRAFT_163207 [Helobdella robusta]ESN96173.1 hypothetical protein HELRODRAFT_163207 [Helobdella robusta]